MSTTTKIRLGEKNRVASDSTGGLVVYRVKGDLNIVKIHAPA